MPFINRACLANRIITIRQENGTTPFPTEIDDEFVTREAYLPQPTTRTPIIVGQLVFFFEVLVSGWTHRLCTHSFRVQPCI